jgi:hypothetical protein
MATHTRRLPRHPYTGNILCKRLRVGEARTIRSKRSGYQRLRDFIDQMWQRAVEQAERHAYGNWN